MNAYIITNPMIAANKSIEVTISKFIRIIKPNYTHLTIIGGNLRIESDIEGVEVISLHIERSKNKARRLLAIVLLQAKMYSIVRKKIKRNDKVFFWIADKMVMPYMAAKKNGAELYYFIYGNVAKEGSLTLLSRLSENLIRYMAEHADYTCMESKSVINEWPGLKPQNSRIIHLYTNNIEMNPIDNRNKTLGMICRLTAGKHVVECIHAMKKIHNDYPEWKLEIIGSGRLQSICEKTIIELSANDYIKMLGWIEHDMIVESTKHWSFFLFPTDTEGMPNSLLEMMGRGIPSLTTPVGGINDVVLDGKNSFMLTNNSQESIEAGIVQLIKMSEKQYKECAKEAYAMIKDKYSYEKAKHNAHKELLHKNIM